MTYTYTVNKAIIKPSNNSDVDAWDVPVNKDWDIIDKAFGGSFPVSLSSSNVTLTQENCQNVHILLQGSLSADVTVYFPAGVGGYYIVDNTTSGAYKVTLASAGGFPGSTVTAVKAACTFVYSDGGNVILADNANLNVSAPLSLTGNNLSISTPIAYNYGGTGLSSYAKGDIIYASAINTLSKLPAGTDGYILTLNSGVPSWLPNSGGGGGGGSVTSIAMTAATNMGLTFTSSSTNPITTSGTFTLSGTLDPRFGGTGIAAVAGTFGYLYANGTSAMSVSSTIPGAQLTGAYTASGMTMATNRLLGRTTAASGAVEEIAVSTGLSYSAGTLALANTSVGAGTYGSSSTVPQITVDAQGRITSASNVSISSSGVSSVSASSSSSGLSLTASPTTGAVSVSLSGTPNTISGSISGSQVSGAVANATNATTAASCSGNAATSTTASTANALSGSAVISTSGSISTSSSSGITASAGPVNANNFVLNGVSSAGLSSASGYVQLNFAANSSIYGNSSLVSCGVTNVGWFVNTSSFSLGSSMTAANAYGFTTWTNVSDSRTKKNVTNYSLSISAINQLNPINYQYNGQYGTPDNGIVYTGLLAQDVLNTPFSSMVGETTDPEGNTLLSVDTSQLVFALVNAVKELSAKVSALEAKVP
jgi:hypothetical protein